MFTKKAEPHNPAFPLLKFYRELLLEKLLPPISCKPNQSRAKKEHGGGFGHGWCQGRYFVGDDMVRDVEIRCEYRGWTLAVNKWRTRAKPVIW